MEILGFSTAITYAAFVAVTAAPLIFLDPAEDPDAKFPVQIASMKNISRPETTAVDGESSAHKDWLLSYGRNDPKKGTPGTDGFLSIENRPDAKVFWNFKPAYALGVSVDGAAFTSVALRKDFKFGPIQVTPYIGPALYQSDVFRHFKSSEIVQFRTGFDILLKARSNLMFGLGTYHISNAGITNGTAGIDVFRVSIQFHH